MNFKKTCLYNKHLESNAKMIEYANYQMPIEFRGIEYEHLAVRNSCGLFDVSHMGKILVEGDDASCFLNFLITNDVIRKEPYKMIYGLMLDDEGFIEDDLMAYKFNDKKYLLVVNAVNFEKDFDLIKNVSLKYKNILVEDVTEEFSEIALQGPSADQFLKNIIKNLPMLKLFEFAEIDFMNHNFLISRSGYTGEDGYEIYGKSDAILFLYEKLMMKNITLCGLGCRDTLRFEAGMPLYGHEISKTINPIEANLSYALAFEKDFIGKEALEKYKKEPKRKIIALEILEKSIARNGYEIINLDSNEVIGYITTGYLLPNREYCLAFGLISLNYSILDLEVGVRVRRNVVRAKIRDKKFMEKKYIK